MRFVVQLVNYASGKWALEIRPEPDEGCAPPAHYEEGEFIKALSTQKLEAIADGENVRIIIEVAG
jgi:hypothetical protein